MFNAGVPVLGVYYGMQTMSEQLGGKVESSDKREFGYAKVQLVKTVSCSIALKIRLADNGRPELDVWMSHGDKVATIPAGLCDYCCYANLPACGDGE